MAESASERILRILLKLSADTEGATQTTNALKQVETQAASTNSAVKNIGTEGGAAEAVGAALSIGFAAAAVSALAVYTHLMSAAQAQQRLAEESLRQNEELDRTVNQMSRIAERARSLDDSVRIGDTVERQLTRLHEQMADWRLKELDAFTSWSSSVESLIRSAFNLLAGTAGPLGAAAALAKGLLPGSATSPQTFEQQEAAKQLEQAHKEVKQLLIDENAELKAAAANTEKWARDTADPAKHIQEYTDKLAQARAETAAAQAAADRDPTEANLQRLNSALQRQNNLGKDLRDLQGMITEDTGKEKDHHESISALMREESTLLAQIRGEQQLISQNPFLSADQKQSLLGQSYAQEMAALNAEIQRQRAIISNTALDPAQLEQARAKLVQMRQEMSLLGLKIQTTTFGGDLRSEMVNWVNQFGTSAHQVAGIITGTLNTAIGSTSQAITGLIFGTKNWQQAFAQAAQSIVANIIQIALQWVVSKILMAAIDRATGQQSGQAATQAATQAAVAWAPSAISASIASYGSAAYTGVAAYGAALAAGEAIAIGGSAVGGGFAEGGRVPGAPSTRDNVLIPMATGETVINSTASTWADRMFGADWHVDLNSMRVPARSGMADGGRIGSAPSFSSSSSSSPGSNTPNIEVYHYVDMHKALKDFQASDAGRKILIDSVNKRRLSIGIR